MRKVFNLSQCFLICAALLVSFKSFADCPALGSGITSSTTCTGNITTIASWVPGINLGNDSGSTNSNNTVNITGNVITSGGRSYGIFIYNGSGITNSNTVNITGNITTSGISTDGIYLENYSGSNNSNTVNMTGNITTGTSGWGIYLYNGDGSTNSNTVNITGNITTGTSGWGIYLYNGVGSTNSSTVNITGNITTGTNGYGIYLNNDTGSNNSNTVNMTGNITTSGYGNGIYLENYYGSTNSNNTVNITGNVITSGANANGIYLLNDKGSNNSNTVNMTGNITTSGGGFGGGFGGSYGISLNNNYGKTNTNTVNLIGNVITSGANANGIYLNNSASSTQNGSDTNNALNMSGDITTTGSSAHGIHLNNSSYAGFGFYLGTNNSTMTNTVNITGNISTNGSSSHGIYLTNTGYGTNNVMANTVNIYGRISATGSSSYAIYGSNADSTYTNIVQLNKGSSIIGAIGVVLDVGTNKLNLNLGAGSSYSFATTGFTVTDLNGRPMVTGSAYAAGVGNITTASQSLYERTSQITQSLDDRVRTYDAKQNTSQDFWVNTYYSDSNRGGQGLSGSNLSFNQYRSGITAGFNVKNSYTPTELIVNYEHGKLNIDEGNQGISSNSVMAGALFPDFKKLFTGTISAKAMVGYSDFSGDRKVLTNDVAFNGSRNVTASYQSTHLTLGSAWTKTLYQTDKMILDTLVGIDLNSQHINSYSESDLFKWNGRTINQLQERVTLGMEIKPLVKPLTLFSRVGIERRDLLSGENQNYAINNTAVSYNDSNQRNTYATLNAGAYYPLTPTVKAYAQVRYYDSVKDIDSLSGSIGISGQF